MSPQGRPKGNLKLNLSFKLPLGGPWGRQGLPEELLGDPLGPFGGLAGPLGLPSVVFPLPGSPPLPPRGLRRPPLVENVPANGCPRGPLPAQGEPFIQ